MGTETIPSSKEGVGAETPSDLERQIIRQIEYYFGNYNLSRDKFLREQLLTDEGWITLETMVKFNRLKKLSEDFNVITEALKKSPKQLMEVSDDNMKIRRRNAAELPEDYKTRLDELDEKTLYVKGFKKSNSLDELLDYFKDFSVEHIFMRRNIRQANKPFKGSVLVTFESRDGAEKFLSTKGIKYCGTELLKEWKKDYVKRKDEVYKNFKEEKAKKILKKAGLKEGKDENDQTEDMESTPGDKEDSKDMVRDCLLKLSNMNKDGTREQIKTAFDPLGTIVYVDYHYGNPSAVIRFETAVATSVLEKITEEEGERKIKVGTSEVVVTAIEGDEEEEYWKLISKSRVKSRQTNAQKRKFGGGHKGPGNRGGGGRFKKWGKRPKGRDWEEEDKETNDKSSGPPQKKGKLEDVGENTEKSSVKMEIVSEVKKETPEVKKETPEIKRDTPEVKTES